MLGEAIAEVGKFGCMSFGKWVLIEVVDWRSWMREGSKDPHFHDLNRFGG